VFLCSCFCLFVLLFNTRVCLSIIVSHNTPHKVHQCTHTHTQSLLGQVSEQLVDAYLARRALDYLVGFNISPLLWRKLRGASSAGALLDCVTTYLCVCACVLCLWCVCLCVRACLCVCVLVVVIVLCVRFIHARCYVHTAMHTHAITCACVCTSVLAGRVQSVTLRLCCEREVEASKFVPEEYWSISVELKVAGDKV